MKPEILNKFTTHLKNTLSEAAYLALELKNKYVNPEHLLYGLAESKGGIAYEILSRAGLQLDQLKEMIRLRNEASLTPSDFSLANLRFSLPAKKALEKAVVVANQYKHKYVGTEHLLYGLLELSDATLEQMLADNHIAIKETKTHLTMVLKQTTKFPDLTGFFDGSNRDFGDPAAAGGMPTPEPMGVGVKDKGGKTPALDFFATNLTTQKLQKDIDPVIGRKREIDRLIHILSRRTKNNPVLVGDPGVGKTAIVEGLAKLVVQGDVPDALANKKILALDLSLVVAGTIYRGEFESRLKQIIEEIKADPNIILFIDELHTIIGAGSASGSMDAANILKPALAKGQIRTIGATTLDEYRKVIESDPALERRFQPIIVDEPSPEEAVAILKGVRSNYERYHGVAITNEAIESAVQLSVRYMQDKFLPDKAIDLIDEAASKLKVTEHNSGLGKQVKMIENDIELLEDEKREAVGQEDFDRALVLKNQQQNLQEKIQRARDRSTDTEKLVGKITRKEVAEVISRITGVPLQELIQEEKQRLLHLEGLLKKRVIGQDEAVKMVADYIRRSRVGLSNPARPLGSFIFLGPSGVGKTELAKALADIVFEDPKALIRIDMSEFSESFNISKLIGAPAGYVGYKEGNKLTDAVRRKPYAVVLFDEIEKAHPDVFNLLLQILDDGHMTDASGKRVNFKNTIIVMTSNVGLQTLNAAAGMGFEIESQEEQKNLESRYEKIKGEVLQELERQFRPEFLNRVDKIIVFQPLNIKVVEKIVQLQIEELAARLAKEQLKIEVTPAARHRIAQQGYNPDQGARAVRRMIQETIENTLAEKLLNGSIKRGDRVRVDVKKDAFTIERATT